MLVHPILALRMLDYLVKSRLISWSVQQEERSIKRKYTKYKKTQKRSYVFDN